MSEQVEFKSIRTMQQGIRLADITSSNQNFESEIVSPNDEVLHENVGQKLSYRLQVRANRYTYSIAHPLLDQ